MTNQELITEENYQNILAYENKTALKVFSQVADKPVLSAWMILIPIVFVPYMQRHQRYKESRKAFSEGYLYTKKIALHVAYQIYKNEISGENARSVIKEMVEKNPHADEKVLNIYDKQIQEIELLSAHYLGLFGTGKVSYGEMILCHYQTEHNYLSFVNKLLEAEKEVNRAASATFKDGVAEVPEIMEKMEKQLEELRLEEIKIFFNLTNPGISHA